MENILHLKAPGDWINDPNGFIYFRGTYHLFYQYFPCAPVWGTMHWGHAISTDLIHWKHLGIALYPTKEYDRNGVFSGSAIEKKGKLYLYYTAERYLEEDPENCTVPLDWKALQSQAMICSEDGISFDNVKGKCQIIPPIEDTSVADPQDCRDPKVWYEEGKYYMCLGSTCRKKEGVLLLYTSEDGENWKYLNRLQDPQLGEILECPDLFAIEGQYFLMASPIGILRGTEYPENQAVLQKICFDSETGKTTLEKERRFLDYGMDLYAPQSNLDAEGRRTVMAWVRMPVPQSPEDNEAADGRPWSGMMALPRLIVLRNGQICTPVHPAVRTYFTEEFCENQSISDSPKRWTREGRTRIVTTLSEGQKIVISGVEIEFSEGCVRTDRSARIPAGVALHAKCRTPVIASAPKAACELEIYVEKNLIEIFVNDGQYVISNVLYPQE